MSTKKSRGSSTFSLTETERKSEPKTQTSYLSSAQIYAKCMGSIINVETHMNVHIGDISFTLKRMGSGFFVDKQYVLTAASLILTPPTLTIDSVELNVTRYDPIHIYIGVESVNGECCAFAYEAALTQLDRAANVALLHIDPELAFNRDKPELKNVVVLTNGNARIYPIGSPVYNISANGFACGNIRENRDRDVTSKYYESIETTIPFHDAMIGSPLLDGNGHVIGMITGANHQSAFGVSEYIFSYCLRGIIGEPGEVRRTKSATNSENVARGWLNIQLQLNTLNTFLEHSPHKHALQGYYVVQQYGNLAVGDLIIEVNNKIVGRCGTNFHSILYDVEPQSHIKIVYYRANEKYMIRRTLDIQVQSVPEDLLPREFSIELSLDDMEEREEPATRSAMIGVSPLGREDEPPKGKNVSSTQGVEIDG